MDDPRAAPPPIAARPGPSRNLIIVVVALLIVVAVGGIVLARRSAPAGALAAASPASTPEAESGPTSGPNEVMFEPGSAKVPGKAADSITVFADGAKATGGTVHLTLRFPTGPNKAKDFALAKDRTTAVHHAMEAQGVRADHIVGDLIEMPAGRVTPRDMDRLEMSLR